MSNCEEGAGLPGGRCSHTGQVDVVLGPVLQRNQLGRLLQLLLAGPAGGHAAEEALQVVGQDLRGHSSEGPQAARGRACDPGDPGSMWATPLQCVVSVGMGLLKTA